MICFHIKASQISLELFKQPFGHRINLSTMHINVLFKLYKSQFSLREHTIMIHWKQSGYPN